MSRPVTGYHWVLADALSDEEGDGDVGAGADGVTGTSPLRRGAGAALATPAADYGEGSEGSDADSEVAEEAAGPEAAPSLATLAAELEVLRRSGVDMRSNAITAAIDALDRLTVAAMQDPPTARASASDSDSDGDGDDDGSVDGDGAGDGGAGAGVDAAGLARGGVESEGAGSDDEEAWAEVVPLEGRDFGRSLYDDRADEADARWLQQRVAARDGGGGRSDAAETAPRSSSSSVGGGGGVGGTYGGYSASQSSYVGAGDVAMAAAATGLDEREGATAPAAASLEWLWWHTLAVAASSSAHRCTLTCASCFSPLAMGAVPLADLIRTTHGVAPAGTADAPAAFVIPDSALDGSSGGLRVALELPDGASAPGVGGCPPVPLSSALVGAVGARVAAAFDALQRVVPNEMAVLQCRRCTVSHGWAISSAAAVADEAPLALRLVVSADALRGPAA